MNKCILCGNIHLKKQQAHFVPFLTERMFQGNTPHTALLYCPQCDFYYSEYRPTDKEMARLYTNYRDYTYQRQRQKYESYYTPEVNEGLTSTKEIIRRTSHLSEILNIYTDTTSMKTILDFGGDKGQFIPHEFRAKKYVYDISNHDIGNRGGGRKYIKRRTLLTYLGSHSMLSCT